MCRLASLRHTTLVFRSLPGQVSTNQSLNKRTLKDLYHYYWQVPEFYTWDGKNSEWKSQKRKTPKIGRMYHASPAQPDRYHLRLLLLHVKGATCYEDIRTFYNIRYG